MGPGGRRSLQGPHGLFHRWPSREAIQAPAAQPTIGASGRSTAAGRGCLDPLANAQRAVAMSNNGTNWKPWCTAYSMPPVGPRAARSWPDRLHAHPGSTPAMTPVSLHHCRTGSFQRCPLQDPDPDRSHPDFTFTRSNGRTWAGAAALIGGGVVLARPHPPATGSIAKATPYLNKFVPQGKPKSKSRVPRNKSQ